MHDLLFYAAGCISSFSLITLGRFLTKNKKKPPINLINGIVLPRPDDPDWKDSNKFNNTFELGNVRVCWSKCGTHHYDNKCHKNYHAFIQQIESDRGVYNICTDERANRYFKEVLHYHMKYMIESPEIKKLNSIK